MRNIMICRCVQLITVDQQIQLTGYLSKYEFISIVCYNYRLSRDMPEEHYLIYYSKNIRTGSCLHGPIPRDTMPVRPIVAWYITAIFDLVMLWHYTNHCLILLYIGLRSHLTDPTSGTRAVLRLECSLDCFSAPTYRYIAPRMIQRIILKFCGYVGCDDATNVSNFGYEPIKFNQLNQ